jgi:hypothetical protein
MQGRREAIIAGFRCMPPSLDYLQVPSEISEPKPIARGTGSSNPVPSSGESAANHGHRGDADELDARGMKSKSRTSVRLHAIGS